MTTNGEISPFPDDLLPSLIILMALHGSRDKGKKWEGHILTDSRTYSLTSCLGFYFFTSSGI